MSSIFISHRNTTFDNDWAKEVHAWIEAEKRISGFLDFDVQYGLEAGNRWEDEIYAAMNRAQVVIALVSPDWLTSEWCKSEVRMARLLGLKIIFFVIDECEHPFGETQTIRVAKGKEQAFERLRHALRGYYGLPRRPYPGLAAFDEKDAGVFFGREEEKQVLAAKVRGLFQGGTGTSALLLLLGASGSGKSSLMRAGLIPDFKSEPSRICLDPIIPGDAPLRKIARALKLSLDGLDAEADADAILDALERACPDFERALIPIDQAEELLRTDKSPAFFEVLRHLIEFGEGRVKVLATMRSDFLNAFQHSGLIGAGTKLKYTTLTLDPLPKARLEDIIRKPAARFGVQFEERLVARIIEDTGGTDSLPLLAFFLDQFWQKSFTEDGLLELHEYESAGGLEKSLQNAVNDALEQCAQLDVAYDRRVLLEDLRELFLGMLVTVNAPGHVGVRRRVPASALTERQKALLTAFAGQRLLIERDGTWEVAHEALFRQWQDLKDWIESAREDLIAIDRIQTAAEHWDKAGREDADLTHGGSRLLEAKRMRGLARFAARFERVKRDYLDACERKESDRYEKEKALREAAERQRDRAEEQRAEAEAEARRALKNQRLGLAALSSVELQAGRAADAVILALAAWPRRADPADDLSDYAVALDALSAACVEQHEVLRLEKHEGVVYSVAFSPDGTQLISGSGDCTLRLWDARTGAQIGAPMEGHEASVRSVAFSPDGTQIVSGSEDCTLRLWDARTGAQIGAPMRGHEAKVRIVAFSPDGTRIVSGSEGLEGTLRLWGARTGAQIGPPMKADDRDVLSVAFSPDGTRMISAKDYYDSLRLWDVRTGAQIGEPMKGPVNQVVSVAFSPDGTQLVCGSSDCTLRLWDTHTGNPIGAPMEGHERGVFSVAFSPDGTRIASGSKDATVRLWDARTGAQIGAPMKGHEFGVNTVAFSPDGKQIASGSGDCTLRLWDLRSGELIGAPIELQVKMEGHKWGAFSGAFSPDGTRIISESPDCTLRLWDARTGAQIGVPMKGHEVGVNTVAFSPDGKQIASGSGDCTLRLWDVRTGTTIGAPMKADDRVVRGVAFSPDGTRVVSWGDDGFHQLWDVRTGTTIGAPMEGHESHVTSVAFSPDGTRIVSGSLDDTVRLWDARTGAQIGAPMKGHRFGVDKVAFSPDGKRIISASSGYFGSLNLWDARTGAQIGILLDMDGKSMEGASIMLGSFVLSPDGGRFVCLCEDKTLRLWDLVTGRQIARLNAPGLQEHDNLTAFAFSLDGTRIASVSSDGMVRSWDVDFGPGNLFEVVSRRLPTRTSPRILSKYGILIDEPICSGEEPLPPIQQALSDDDLFGPVPNPPPDADPFGMGAPPMPPQPPARPPVPDPFALSDTPTPPWPSPPPQALPSSGNLFGSDDLPSPPPYAPAPPPVPPTGLDMPEDPFAQPPKPRDPTQEESE